ncbi:hypothetical protein BG015_011972 [Linnemannia schmuckeri]|uniref:F-box domain-containing protein n=1 Tax=Linnemannia schmuckeri TaxID=64567 RepID=A0A9P5S4E2_9FUNG|nr:hypothetical protein BG015_011972 [Linnemannia schmuckeri]
MHISSNTPSTIPLDLPEIRTRIASYLSRKDCISCMCVSRNWLQDFAPPVWHTIDFSKNMTAFAAVAPTALDKYGHLIAEVLNVKTSENLQTLQHSRVDSIRSMNVCIPSNWLYRELLSDLMLRCSGFIKVLSIRSDPPNPNTLDKLALFGVMIICHKPTLTLYTGSRLRCLSASFGQLWCNDNEDSSAPCLLLHFPLLEKWHMAWLAQPSYQKIDLNRLDFSTWCPKLNSISFGSDNTEAMSTLLLNAFNNLKSCKISAKNLTMSTAFGLISQQETLTSVTITDKLQDDVSMQWLYQIVKLCRGLLFLSFESLVCDLETIESWRWGCKDLRELRVRFKGLDNAWDIDGCLKRLCDWRRFGGGASLIRFKDKETVATRVCHYLFQFNQLRTVWLGTKDYYLPPSLI